MDICITATSDNLDGMMDERFGRCKYFIFVDPVTMKYRAVPNTSINESSGAGIASATTVLKNSPSAIITGLIGGNAMEVLKAANARVYTCQNRTVREAVGMYNEGKLESIEAPNNKK